MAQHRPFIIGLTGAIGMGKTQTARLFAEEGIPVFDADAAVHAFYAGLLAEQIERAFPGTVRDGAVDRALLSAVLAKEEDGLERLEAIVHPAVAAARARFLEENKDQPLVLFDIPLLLETGIAVDRLVVATAPENVQRARVLARPGMTEAKFKALSSRQLSDAQKRAQANYLVTTDKGLEDARAQVKMILSDIRRKLTHA